MRFVPRAIALALVVASLAPASRAQVRHGELVVYFNGFSDYVTPSAKDSLRTHAGEITQLVSAMTIAHAAPEVVTVTGYCNLLETISDGNGGPAKDGGKDLSLHRAQAVKQALLDLGVPSSVTINVAGAGFSNPKVPESMTAEDRKQAREGFGRGEPGNRYAIVSY